MHELKNKFKNKKILIYGYGKSGRASFNYLKKKNEVFIYDDFKKLKNLPFITLVNIKNLSFDYILVSPGINIRKCKLKNFLKNHGNKIVTDLDIFYIVYGQVPWRPSD